MIRSRSIVLFAVLIAVAVAAVAAVAATTSIAQAAPEQNALRLYLDSLWPKAAFEGLLRVTGRELALQVEVRRLDGMTGYFFRDGAGMPTEIVRGDGRMIVKGGPAGVFGGGMPFFLDLIDTTDLIQQNYSVSLAGRDVVGGRPAQRIEITPRKAGRPYRVVWIDEATGIQLRREDYRYDGSLIERRELVSVSVPAAASGAEARRWKNMLRNPGPSGFLLVNPRMIAAPMAGGSQMKMPGLPGMQLLPAHVPEGYCFVGERAPVQLRGGVRHLVWTDGIGVISVFERPVPWWARRGQPPTQRADGGVEWETGGVWFLLIGDAAPDELLEMAASFVPKN